MFKHDLAGKAIKHALVGSIVVGYTVVATAVKARDAVVNLICA